MSKYNIRMPDYCGCEQWVAALTGTLYLFLSKQYMPTESQLTYLLETYQGEISPGIILQEVALYPERGKYTVEKKGWALVRSVRSGPAITSSNWQLSKLQEMCAERKLSERKFETIIAVYFENTSHDGFLNVDLRYEILKKAPHIEIRRARYGDPPDFDFYTIPKTEDLLTYIPTLDDLKSHIRANMHLPYSLQTIKVIKDIQSGVSNLINIGKELLSVSEDMPGHQSDKLAHAIPKFYDLIHVIGETWGEYCGTKSQETKE